MAVYGYRGQKSWSGRKYPALARKVSAVKKASKKRRTDDSRDANVFAMFTDKSPTPSEQQVALRRQANVWMKTFTEQGNSVSVENGAFTTLATIQMNSVFEPVDTETEQPRAHDTMTTLFKRCRVSKCAIECLITAILNNAATAGGSGCVLIAGMTAHVAGEAPATLREAMENPRTVYKVMNHDMTGVFGTYVDGLYSYKPARCILRGSFDCAEVFGNKKEYYTLDDTVNASANPTTLVICTVWAGCAMAGNGADDFQFFTGITTNQKCRWFMPEKLTSS